VLFCSTNNFLHLSGNLKIPSFQNLSGFSVKNFSKWFFTSTKELKLFPLREFCNDRNRWKSESARERLVNMVDGIEHPQPSSNNFCRVIKNTWGRALSSWNTTPFRFAISGRFCSIAIFNSSNWEQYFSEFIVSLFGKSSYTGSLSNPRAWPSLDEDRLLGWLKVVHSAFPKIFFAQHYCKWSIFHPPSLLASKMVSPRCV